ncbi:17646_t:CDS:1, partial [Funneliformis geosporum]
MSLETRFDNARASSKAIVKSRLAPYITNTMYLNWELQMPKRVMSTVLVSYGSYQMVVLLFIVK